ncbi:MAG TPA: cupredoxin domain-containing protein [Chthoniobacterales bacterium]|nr:cupredoxin domain-containing protein [Chthoniobacterales bacterium]
MNTTKFVIAFLACAFCFAVAQAEEKTVAEKTEEVWDETKKKTKEVSKAVVKTTKETSKAVAKKTKETVKAIEHKIDTPDADARKVNVTITDGGVQMPASLRPGKTAFVVTNSGKQKHNFEIEGEHLDKSFWFAIAPKDSKTMQVDLKPGSYDAHCNIGEHANKEAKVKLVVK